MNRLNNKYVWLTLLVASLSILLFQHKIFSSNSSKEGVNQALPMSSNQSFEQVTRHESTESSQITLSLEDCKNIFARNQTPQELLIQKRYLLSSLIRNLQREGLDKITIEIIGDVAGLTKSDVYYATSGVVPSEFMKSLNQMFLPPYEKDDGPTLKFEKVKMLDDLISEGDYEGLETAVKQKTIAPNSNRFGESILAIVLKSNRTISYAQLQALINSGVTVDFRAIVKAVELNAETNKIKLLVENYHKPLDLVWIEDDLPMNLTLYSARNLRPDLFSYFNTEKQINPYAEFYAGFNNILDSLPEPKSDAEKKMAVSFVKGALKYGQIPIRYSAAKRIESYLPDDVKTQYAKQLSSWMKPTNDMIEKAEKIKEQISDKDRQIANAELNLSLCKDKHNYSLESYLKDLTSKNTKSSNLSLATKRQLSNFVQVKMTDFFSNPKKFITQAIEKGEIVKYSPPPADLIEKRNKLSELISERKWDLALTQCEQFGDKEGYDMLISSYLWSDSPDSQFIQSLVEKGAKIDSQAIITLSTKGNITLIEKLTPYGLDFKYLSIYGTNALSQSVTNLNNSDIVKYLIDHGTPVKPQTLGMDPLDLALEQLDTFNPQFADPNNARFNNIAVLIASGAPIERSHLEKLVQLKITNPDAFEKLLGLIPELKRYVD